jgi:hypothetical protein
VGPNAGLDGLRNSLRDAREFVSYWLTPIVQLLLVGYAIFRLISGVSSRMVAYWSLAIAQAFINMGIWLRSKRVRGQRTPIPVPIAVALGVVQGGLAAARAARFELPPATAS